MHGSARHSQAFSAGAKTYLQAVSLAKLSSLTRMFQHTKHTSPPSFRRNLKNELPVKVFWHGHTKCSSPCCLQACYPHDSACKVIFTSSSLAPSHRPNVLINLNMPALFRAQQQQHTSGTLKVSVYPLLLFLDVAHRTCLLTSKSNNGLCSDARAFRTSAGMATATRVGTSFS